MVQAQGSTPAPAAAPPATDLSPAERAKRDAEKVFQWIRIQSDKPKRTPAATTEKAAAVAPAPARPVAKAAPKPADSGITETVAPLSPVAARAAAAKPAAVAPMPAPVVAKQETVSQTVAARSDTAAPVAALTSPPVEPEQDLALVPVAQAEPDFPGVLMRTLRKGSVQVKFTVRPDGSVAEAHAVSSSSPRLVQTAVETVSQWRFQPLHHAQQGVVELGFDLD
ncbi:MAG TPA: TonB family protein [Albitalea sp.]|nr:TonB family protein [Albitalea sp.]